MRLDKKAYRLTNRQSQCDCDLDFGQFSSRGGELSDSDSDSDSDRYGNNSGGSK
jgi:hypothetical protein